MKKIILAPIFFGLSIFGYGQDVDNSSFVSAEERIVYNKTNHLGKYEGVLVEYEYRLVNAPVQSKEEWRLVCDSYFINIEGVEVYQINRVNYFSVLTMGSRKNHESSYSLPVDLGYKIEFSRRKYHLK